MTDSVKPRVFLVDDHELIRSGIRAEIAGSVDIVGEADEVEARRWIDHLGAKNRYVLDVWAGS